MFPVVRRGLTTTIGLVRRRLLCRSMSSIASSSASSSSSSSLVASRSMRRLLLGPMSKPLWQVQRRTLFVRTHETPNERCLKFVPGQPVLAGLGDETRDFQSPQQALASPLAEELFKISGVSGAFFSRDFLTVTIADAADWPLVKPEVFSVLMNFFASEKPILAESNPAEAVAANEEDDDVVAMIKELIDTRIRPAVQADGGDLAFLGFSNGIVSVQLQGACVGCSSSSITLKNGIENMLMHYVPEVEGVENVETEMDEVSNAAFEKLEENLRKIKQL